MKAQIIFYKEASLALLFLMFFSFNGLAQTEYYSTNGKNRLTKAEVEKQKEELKQKFTKLTKQDMFVDIKIKNTQTKKDSIIQNITFKVHDGKNGGAATKSYIDQLKDSQFPEFELQALFGENYNSTQLKGKPTMINFWFTKCAPCIDEMPVLNKIYDQYKNDVNFIAITYESQEKVTEFLKKHPFKFKQLVNAESFTEALEIKAYPLNLFLDTNGILKHIENGIPYMIKEGEQGMKIGDGKEIMAILDQLIAE